MSDLPGSDRQQALKWCGRVAAVLASLLIIVAHEGLGPPYFDAIGKALFWSDIVLVPLLRFNQDVLSLANGKMAAVALFALHLVFVAYSFGKLENLTFILLTPIGFGQCLLFMLPFMLIRKRHTGIWY